MTNPSSGSPGGEHRVITGLERLLTEEAGLLRGKRLGLIANATSVDSSLARGIDRLHGLSVAQLMVLLGPEHGLRGFAQDQIEIEDEIDLPTGLAVRSLYGPCRSPSAEMLTGLDAVIFDIQDIGSRYYTYIWTMAHAMEACARVGVELIVADRPNPIGGELVEGNLIEGDCRSFVGLYPIPNRHGMTAGELSRLFNEEYGIGCPLTVISMKGWRRSHLFGQTGLPWVAPSPNMPTLETAGVYPGACLFEGTNLSEGRGTTQPFEILGAPWVEPFRLAAEVEKEGLAGVRCRPLYFQPTFHKFAGRICGGIQQHIVDWNSYRPWLSALAIIKAVYRLWPSEFAWRPPPYEYESERPAIDILGGSGKLREMITVDLPLKEINVFWQEELLRFKSIRERYLLY